MVVIATVTAGENLSAPIPNRPSVAWEGAQKSSCWSGCWQSVNFFFCCAAVNRVAPLPLNRSLNTFNAVKKPLGDLSALLGMPDYLLAVLSHLSPSDLCSFLQTAQKGKQITEHDGIWRTFAARGGYEWLEKRSVVTGTFKNLFKEIYLREQDCHFFDLCKAFKSVPSLAKRAKFWTLVVNPSYLPEMRAFLLKDRDFQKLEQLNLRDQGLKELSAGHCLPLTILNLGLNRNSLSKLPASLSALEILSRLDLSENLFVEIPSVIQQLRQLEFLNLHNNRIVEVPVWLGTLRKLVHLDLSNNLIRALPEKLIPFRHIRAVLLHSNCLTVLPNWIEELGCEENFEKMELLNVGFNVLTSKAVEFIQSLQNVEFIIYTEDMRTEKDIRRATPRIRAITTKGRDLLYRIQTAETVYERDFSMTTRRFFMDEEKEERKEG